MVNESSVQIAAKITALQQTVSNIGGLKQQIREAIADEKSAQTMYERMVQDAKKLADTEYANFLASQPGSYFKVHARIY